MKKTNNGVQKRAGKSSTNDTKLGGEEMIEINI